MVIWSRRVDPDLNKKLLKDLDAIGLYSVDDVSKFLKSFEEKPTLMERKILDSIRKDKTNSVSYMRELFSVTTLAAVTMSWNLIEQMLIELKRTNPRARGFSTYYHLNSNLNVPDIQLLLPDDKDELHVQVEFGNLVCLVKQQQSSLHARGRTGYEIDNFRIEFSDALKLICKQLKTMRFDSIRPTLTPM